MFALYRAVSVCPCKPSRDGVDDAQSRASGVRLSHLGCFGRLEVRMHMLVLHRPRVGNVQKHPTVQRDGENNKGMCREGQGLGSTNLL